MSEIKKGDLVMVVKPLECCGGTEKLSHVFRVSEVSIIKTRCHSCGDEDGNSVRARRPSGGAYHLSRLIKIDPPALPESTETRESLTA